MTRVLLLAACGAALCAAAPSPTAPFDASNTTWHLVWTGGQSNSIGTNSQTTGYPTWPTTPLIQMYCWNGQRGCTKGTFSPAAVPLYGESNVGFSQTCVGGAGCQVGPQALLEGIPPLLNEAPLCARTYG